METPTISRAIRLISMEEKTRAMCPGCVAKLNLNDKEGGFERVHYEKSMKRNRLSDDVDEEE